MGGGGDKWATRHGREEDRVIKGARQELSKLVLYRINLCHFPWLEEPHDHSRAGETQVGILVQHTHQHKYHKSQVKKGAKTDGRQEQFDGVFQSHM